MRICLRVSQVDNWIKIFDFYEVNCRSHHSEFLEQQKRDASQPEADKKLKTNWTKKNIKCFLNKSLKKIFRKRNHLLRIIFAKTSSEKKLTCDSGKVNSADGNTKNFNFM